jgi:hypothetical protein
MTVVLVLWICWAKTPYCPPDQDMMGAPVIYTAPSMAECEADAKQYYNTGMSGALATWQVGRYKCYIPGDDL